MKHEYDDFAAQLIGSAAGDRSPRDARTRAMAALGLGGPGAIASAATKAATSAATNGAATGLASTGAKLGGVFVAKWLGIAVVGGLATAGVVAARAPATAAQPVMVRTATHAAANASGAPAVTAATTLPSLPSPAPVEAPAAPVPAPSPSPLPAPASAAPPRASTFAEQAHALDDVRAVVNAGNGPRALSMLDDFGRRFPRSALGEEALVLRIEALVASGDHYAANAAAARFFAQYPNSLYARRVRSVVGDSSLQ